MKIFGSLALLLGLISCLTLLYGQTPLPLIWDSILLRIGGYDVPFNPLLDERLPRLIVLISTGASLAVAGAVMQALFQNPLASPSVLGISFGGSLLVVVVCLLDLHLKTPYAIPIAAFTGCLATLFMVYFLSRTHKSLNNLILTGIAISTVLLAVQSALMYAIRDRYLLIQALTEWEAGSTHDLSWKQVHMQLPLTIVGLLGCLRYREALNILALGDEQASILGVDVPVIRFRLFLFVAILTGGALATVGVIAFFGLILPHVVRALIGPDNRLVIPLAILGGAVSLAGLDLSLRFFSIHTFSIGNISAILGGVFFLVILLKQNRTSLLT